MFSKTPITACYKFKVIHITGINSLNYSILIT